MNEELSKRKARALIRAMAENLRDALLSYGADEVISDARESGHTLSHRETLDSGELMTIDFSIKITREG